MAVIGDGGKGISGDKGLGEQEELAVIVRMGARSGRLEMFGLSESLSRSSSVEDLGEEVATDVIEVEPLDEGDDVVEDEEVRGEMLSRGIGSTGEVYGGGTGGRGRGLIWR